VRSIAVRFIGVFSVLLLLSLPTLASAAQAPLLSDKAAYKLEISQIVDAQNKKAVSIKVTPKENSKMNPEFPTKLNIKAPAGFQFVQESFTAKDFSKYTEKSFEIALQFSDTAATASGDLAIEFRFGTCNVANGQTKSCMMQNEKLNFRLEAPAAGAR